MKLLPLPLVIVMILVLRDAVSICGYDRQCPHSSQRGFRIRSECSGNSTVYNCLYNTKNKTYVEFCEKNEEARAGLKYVISGSFRNVRCSEERYQPITFWTNRSTDCLFLKAQCSETGQIVFDNSSTISDSYCRCDYTRHYAFVSPPRNPCFCTPSTEDCSCYIKQCPNNTTLSPDFECVYLNSTEKTFNCKPVIHAHTNGSDMDTFQKGTNKEQYKQWMMSLKTTLAVQIVCSITLIAGLLAVIILIFHGRRGRHTKITKQRQNLYDFSETGNSDELNLQTFRRNDVHKCNNAGITPLVTECVDGDVSTINRFIERGAGTNMNDKGGDTVFSLSGLGGNINKVNLLMDKGYDMNKPNNKGKTPLMEACGKGNLSIVNRLLERGADINMTDEDGDTPFSWSCLGGNIDIVNLLMDKGYEINKPKD